MSPPPLVDRLAALSLFAGLDPQELGRVAHACHPFALAPGEVLFRQGDAAERMYVVEAGSLRLSRRVLHRDCFDMGAVGPGEVVGELSLLDAGERAATATADGATAGQYVSRRAFEALALEGDALGIKLLLALARLTAVRLTDASADVATRPPGPGDCRPAASVPDRSTPIDPAMRVDPAALDRRLLGQLPFFQAFEPVQIDALFAHFGVWDVPRGHVLFAEGETGRACYVIARGAVVVRARQGDMSRRLGVRGPGRMVGELALLGEGTRMATCIVRERATLLELGEAGFDALVRTDAAIGTRVLAQLNRLLAESLRRTTRTLVRIQAQAPCAPLHVDLDGVDL